MFCILRFYRPLFSVCMHACLVHYWEYFDCGDTEDMPKHVDRLLLNIGSLFRNRYRIQVCWCETYRKLDSIYRKNIALPEEQELIILKTRSCLIDKTLTYKNFRFRSSMIFVFRLFLLRFLRFSWFLYRKSSEEVATVKFIKLLTKRTILW